MNTRDLHVHTNFSDGADTPARMVEAALAKGYAAIGFADHAPTSFDLSWCMAPERVADYRAAVAALKETYRGRIEVLCGIEQDYYADTPAEGYDFVEGEEESAAEGEASDAAHRLCVSRRGVRHDRRNL